MTLRGLQTTERVIVRGGYYYRPERAFAADESAQRAQVERTFGPERLRRLDPLSQCALLAVHRARVAAGIAEERRVNKRSYEGVCVGTAFGAQTTRVRYARRLAEHGSAATNPIDFPDSIDGAAAAHVAIQWGLQGPSLTFVEGARSAEHALVAACRQIVDAHVERMMLVTGDIFDPWLRQTIVSAARATAATSRGIDAAAAADVPRDAVLALVLERSDTLSLRGAVVEVAGFLGDCSIEPERHVVDLVRDVPTPTTDPGDFSGTSLVAGAWLGATDPMGSQAGSWQGDDVRANSWRCQLGVEQFPQLAFVRKEWPL